MNEREFQLESQAEERQRLGLMTITETATVIGVTRDRMDWWLRQGQLPAPAARIAGRPRKYYVAADLPVLREFFAARA